MFKVGQKVVCIDDTNLAPKAVIKLNEIYTIKEIITNESGHVDFLLEETYNGVKFGYPFFYGYRSERFRPIDNKWVEELLEKMFSEVEL